MAGGTPAPAPARVSERSARPLRRAQVRRAQVRRRAPLPGPCGGQWTTRSRGGRAPCADGPSLKCGERAAFPRPAWRAGVLARVESRDACVLAQTSAFRAPVARPQLPLHRREPSRARPHPRATLRRGWARLPQAPIAPQSTQVRVRARPPVPEQPGAEGEGSTGPRSRAGRRLAECRAGHAEPARPTPQSSRPPRPLPRRLRPRP